MVQATGCCTEYRVWYRIQSMVQDTGCGTGYRMKYRILSVVQDTGGICYTNGIFRHEPKSGKDFLVMSVN